MTRNTEPHGKTWSSEPDTSGPSTAEPVPSADHRAMALVRAGPDHSTVIRASVVGKVRPAPSPPMTRAAIRTSVEGAMPATREAGIASDIPITIIRLRPYRSPSAPNHSTEAARPRE